MSYRQNPQWEVGTVEEIHTPPDDGPFTREVTFKVRYPDGTVRFLAVTARQTARFEEAVPAPGETKGAQE